MHNDTCQQHNNNTRLSLFIFHLFPLSFLSTLPPKKNPLFTFSPNSPQSYSIRIPYWWWWPWCIINFYKYLWNLFFALFFFFFLLFFHYSSLFLFFSVSFFFLLFIKLYFLLPYYIIYIIRSFIYTSYNIRIHYYQIYKTLLFINHVNVRFGSNCTIITSSAYQITTSS